MRYFTFLLLFSLCLSVFAQKKMTIRNSETGDEMTITVPDGLVITSGIEGEDADFVVIAAPTNVYSTNHIDVAMSKRTCFAHYIGH